MNRKIIPVSHPQLTSLDLEAFVRQARALNQRNHDTFTTPFPKHASRWISHYPFQPRPITFTDKGAVEGGLSLGCLNRPSAVARFLASSCRSRLCHLRWSNIFNHTRGLLGRQMRPILMFIIY